MKNLFIAVSSLVLALSATSVIASDSKGSASFSPQLMEIQQKANAKVKQAMLGTTEAKIELDYTADYPVPEENKRKIVLDYTK